MIRASIHQVVSSALDGSFATPTVICLLQAFLPQANSTLEAEGLSMLHALQLTWYRGYRWLILEGDSQFLMELINERRKNITIT